VAPLQPPTDEDLTDPAASHGDALAGQIGHQPIQGPAGEGEAQLGGPGQGCGDDGTALLSRIRRRSSGAHVLFQPFQAACVKAVEPVANRVTAQIHPAGNLLRLQATQSMDDNLGTADDPGSERVGARDPPNFRPFIIRHFPQPKSHDPAPMHTGMILQQRRGATISAYLPDAPLR